MTLLQAIRRWFWLGDARTPAGRALLGEQFRILTSQVPVLYGVLIIDSLSIAYVLPASRYGQDVASHYTKAWLGKYLQHDPAADDIFRAEQQRDHSGDAPKYAYMAEAARPDSTTKQKYFEDYLHNSARPEDWVEESLGAFNYWNQSELTAPYLKPALEALPQVKRERKIFFLVSWLNAFIGGQQSAAADTEVHDWLRANKIDPDLRLKVLEVVDELDRTVRIRQRYP